MLIKFFLSFFKVIDHKLVHNIQEKQQKAPAHSVYVQIDTLKVAITKFLQILPVDVDGSNISKDKYLGKLSF